MPSPYLVRCVWWELLKTGFTRVASEMTGGESKTDSPVDSVLLFVMRRSGVRFISPAPVQKRVHCY